MLYTNGEVQQPGAIEQAPRNSSGVTWVQKNTDAAEGNSSAFFKTCEENTTTAKEETNILDYTTTEGVARCVTFAPSSISDGACGSVGSGDKRRQSVRKTWSNPMQKDKSKRSKFTPEEDQIIIECLREFGKRWQEIAKRLEGRTPIMIRNRYYAKLRKHIGGLEGL